MRVTKRIDLVLLERELSAASVSVSGLGMSGEHPDDPGAQDLFTYAGGLPAELPPEASPVVDAHTAPPLVTEYAGRQTVSAVVRTTDDVAKEVFRFPCLERHLYQASLTISGIDAGSFAVKLMEGRFVWKRITASVIMTGITVVSDLHDTAAAAWAPNAVPQGTDIVFTVRGAAGRTIDWLLTGTVDTFAPDGLMT